MLKLLLGLFLIINSLIGLLFYESTALGDYLAKSNALSLVFVVINFVLSNAILVIFRIEPFSVVAIILLVLFLLLIVLIAGLGIPYWLMFEVLGANSESLFLITVYIILEIGILSVLMAPIFQWILSFLGKLNEAFFEGLKENAINNALRRNK